EIDLIAGANDLIYNQPDLLLSKPYIINKPAIIERNDWMENNNNTPLQIGISKSYQHNEYYTQLFEHGQYKVYDSPRRALELLSFNKLDLFIGDMTIANYVINQSNLNNLHVRPLEQEGTHGFSFASLKGSNEPLITILNKVLSVTPNRI